MLKKYFYAYVFSWLVFFGFSVVRYAQILANKCRFFTNGWLACAPQSDLDGLQVFVIIFLIIAAFACFLWVTRLLWQSNDQTIDIPKKLKYILLGLGVLAVFVVPLGTSDMPYYFSAGKAMSQNLNPYFDKWTLQVDFSDRGAFAPTAGFPYGPIMALASGLFYRISYDNVLVFMLAWKFFMLLTLVACGFLTMKLAEMLSGGKNSTTWYVLWFAQPILLFEWLVNGHFDGLWLLSVLLAIYAAHTKRWWLLAPALVVGVWIKFIPILLAPFFALWWWQDINMQTWKKNISQMAFGLVIAGLITFFSWQPYWAGPAVFASIISQSKFASMSIFATAYYSLKPLFVWLLADQAHFYLTRLVQGTLLLAVIYLLYPIIKKCLAVLFRKTKLESGEYVQTIFIFMLVYLMVWQKSYWPWYGVWFLPLSLIAYKVYQHPYVLKIGMWFCLSSPIYHILSWITLRTDAISKDELWFYYLSVGITMVYPLYLIFKWRQKNFALTNESSVNNA